MKPTYSHYIQHPLNRSPSKTSYTFNRAPRFAETHPQVLDPSFLTGNSHRASSKQDLAYRPYRVSPERQGRRPNGKSRSRSPGGGRVNTVAPTIEYIERIRARNYIQGGGRNSPYKPLSPERRKSRSINKQAYDYTFSPMSPKPKVTSKKNSPTKGKRNSKSKSPSRRKTPSGQKGSPSRQRGSPLGQRSSPLGRRKAYSPDRKSSPPRSGLYSQPVLTMTQYLQSIDHQSQHITIGGYYPTGTQITPNGKYISSTMRNVPSSSFGRSDRFQPIRRDHQAGPGAYHNFSQFGPQY